MTGRPGVAVQLSFDDVEAIAGAEAILRDRAEHTRDPFIAGEARRLAVQLGELLADVAATARSAR